MIVFSYQMFRTPLDDEYKNVYDNYTSVSEYLSFLSTYSPAKTGAISVPTISRSVKSINGDIVLPINQFRADEIERNGYNYVSVLASPEATVEPAFYRFYFIQKIESLNDNHDSSVTNLRSCKLFLKYDTWTNNYLDNIKNSSHQQTVTKATISHIVNSSRDINIKTDIIDMRHSYESIPQSNLVGYGVLSLGVRLAKEVAAIRKSGQDVGTIPAQNYAPVVYIPLKHMRLSGTGTYTLKDSSDETITVGGADSDFTIPEYLNDARVLSMWLTYYGISASSINVGGTYSLLTDNNIVEVTLAEGDIPFKAITAPNYDFSEIILFSDSVNNAPTTAHGYDELKEYSEELNLYPFKGKGVLIGDKVIPLKYSSVDSVNVVISRKNSTTPNVYLEARNNSSVIFQTKSHLLDSFAFPVGKYVDSLELYYMNNQSQITTKIAKSATGMVFGGASAFALGMLGDVRGAISGAQSMVNAGMDIAMLNAQATDADRSLDSYSIPAFIGSDSVYYDGVFVVDCQIRDENIKRAYFYDSHCNGVKVADSMTIGKVNKELFDYVQTIGCNIPDIPIIVHRKEIESAFDRGIRKFHISALNKQAAFDCEAEYANNSIWEG